MKQKLLSILLFPLDLIYFTLDSAIATWRFLRRVMRKERTQKCHFCEGEASEDVPFVVRSVLKYQNKWLVRILAPHITFRSDGKRRIGFSKCEDGYFQPPGYIPLVFVFMLLIWSAVIVIPLMSVSSDRDNFVRNFVSTFNPETLGKDEDTTVDFLEQGETRLNPERAERYYLSGIRHLDQRRFPNAQVDLKIAIQSNPADPKLHFNLARALLGTGQRVQAEASLRKTLELDKEQVEAMLFLAEILQAREQEAEARSLAVRALELAPENQRAIRMNLAVFAATGDQEKARPLMDKLYEKDSENPDVLTFLGKMELGLFEDRELGQQRIEDALALSPDFVPARIAMISIYGLDNDLKKIQLGLEEILQLEPENMQALRLQAEFMLNQYGIGPGLRAYEALLTRYGGNLDFRLRYAELLMQAGRISEGKTIAEQLTASRVPRIERTAHWMLAQMFSSVRMYEDGIRHGRSTLRMSPNARNVHLFLCQSLLSLNRVTEAKREAEAAFALNPKDLQAINLMTQCLIRLDQTGEAIAFLDQLIEENPDADALILRKSEILMQTPQWAESIPYISTLLDKYPDNASLRNNMAFVLARSGQELDRATSLAGALAEEFPENPVILDTLAFVMAAKGQHEQALPVYEDALSKAAANATIRYHYAKSLLALERNEEAKAQLRAVLIMDPKFNEADDARAMLEALTTAGA